MYTNTKLLFIHVNTALCCFNAGKEQDRQESLTGTESAL